MTVPCHKERNVVKGRIFNLSSDLKRFLNAFGMTFGCHSERNVVKGRSLKSLSFMGFLSRFPPSEMADVG